MPGLAKTLMISTLSRCLSLAFSRIQFTPDLMPSDITGTEIIQENKTTGGREFRFMAGPLFDSDELPVEVEYEGAVVSQYPVAEATSRLRPSVGVSNAPSEPVGTAQFPVPGTPTAPPGIGRRVVASMSLPCEIFPGSSKW